MERVEWSFRNEMPGNAWPAIGTPQASAKIALLRQLDESQWLPQERLQELQRSQLKLLLAHAAATSPYYRARWGSAPHVGDLAQLPLLTRRDIQDSYEELKSERLPREHGRTAEVRTSGSTGAPIRVLSTQLAELFWNSITLREHSWHRRDFNGKLAAIRHGIDGAKSSNWGKATAGVVATGPALGLGIQADTDSQLAWLERERPDYLLTFPSNAAELARSCLRAGIKLPGLREVRTMGEALAEQTRQLCRDAWDVPVVDFYSAEEVGYIALQCPEHEHYHAQAETRIVEVLDESGNPCLPGQTGRVVVTDLNNFAMPLVRYEIGDIAEVGEPCPCGRGLPVLSRILGRVRNMLTAADGKRYFPTFGTRSMPGVEKLRQHQFVQKSFTLVEARLVVAEPFDAQVESALREHVLSRLPSGFEVKFVYVDSIARSPSGKFEDFVSEVAA
jgi:phenylacetate-CoA ligase